MSFQSSALGRPMEYRDYWSDQVGLVLSAKSGNGGKIACREVTGPYSDIYHTHEQASQVLLDFDTHELKSRHSVLT
jgi:hypothetical protein